MNSKVQLDAASSLTMQPAQKKKYVRIFLLFVVPALAVAVGGFIYLHGGRYISTDNAYVKADKIPISTEVAGQVSEVLVSENQKVARGDVLFRLDRAPFSVAVAKAQAQLSQVRTELAAAKASYAAKKAELQVAESRLNFAHKQQVRQKDLRKQDFVSESQWEEAEQRFEVASLEVNAAQKDLQRIAEMLNGQPDGAIEDMPQYKSAQAVLEEAQLKLAWAEVKAPASGSVSLPPRVGQHLNTGQSALTLVSDNNIWVEANFTETELTHINAGQSVHVAIDTYPNFEWQGVVQSISPASGAEFSLLPAQNVTGNWVKIAQRIPVRIALTITADEPQLRAGMSAEVKVDTHFKRRLVGLHL